MTYTPKHTNEEYLAWIDGRIVFLDRYMPRIEINSLDNWQASNYRASLLANRDVLERHKEYVFQEERVIRREVRACKGCSGLCDGTYRIANFPCLTYLNIAQRLDEVM